MSPFRGSDEQLDREIATVERIARVRLRRTIADMRELDADLRELKRERARRRVAQTEHLGETVGEETPTAAGD